MLIPSSDTFKNDMFHFSPITFHVLNLEPCSLSWNPSSLFFSWVFPNPNQSLSPVWLHHTPNPFIHHSRLVIKYVHLQCWQVHLRSGPPAPIASTSGSKNEEVIKVSLIGKCRLGASCVCQHMLRQGLQFPRCRRAVPTVWGNFQRCCNRSTFQCAFHFSLLAVKGVIAMRQTASACSEFGLFWKSTITWAMQ